jgi:hypothetical protein
VKVLDFGLAKMLDSRNAAESTDVTRSLTHSPVATHAGVILGTAAYMAPEQAKGRPIDKRSDLWAFGCVVYEMLTGRRAFDGEDAGDTLASVLRAEPDWHALPVATPASIRRLLRRCLEKDRKRRLSDIADARLEIEDALSAPAAEVPAGSAARSRQRPVPTALVAMAGLVVGGVAAGTGVWMATSPNPGPVTRTTIGTSAEAPAMARGLAIAPDGSRVVYVSTDRPWCAVSTSSKPRKSPIWAGQSSRSSRPTANGSGSSMD